MVRFMFSSLFALTLVSALVSVPTASAQTSAPADETNLIRSLQELGYRHRVTAEGWTVVEVPTENGVTEVYISPLQNIEGKRVHVIRIAVGSLGGEITKGVENVLRQIVKDLP